MKKTLFFLVTLALVGFSACSDDDDNVVIPKPDFGATITLDGKGTTGAYENSVYVDFSTSSQVAVNRKSWNLGFSNGKDFRVILNSADATTAVSSGKTDINAVTLADANAAQEIGGTAYMTPAGLPLSVVDAINGDLAGSVFAAVSANSADNLVYFVAPEDNKSSRDLWYKVKVDRSANGGYSVQYGQVGDSLITTVEVAKNAAYNLSFLSFADKKTVTVEPESKKWDIMWGFNTGLRAPDLKSTYFLQDYVAINTLAGAQAVEVLTTTSTFANYSKANISTSTFSSDKDVIGDKWRSTSAYGGGTLGIKTDRFYVVKDPEGNYYKLRFLKMGLGNDGGERGRPVLEYELLN